MIPYGHTERRNQAISTNEDEANVARAMSAKTSEVSPCADLTRSRGSGRRPAGVC